jgi:predicted nucleic acid-binding protein
VSDLVIDAGVAVKWVIEEEGTKEALALAEAEALRFVTADASLVRKVGRQPSGRYAGRVLGLADAATWQG